jgi:hypothetical protein
MKRFLTKVAKKAANGLLAVIHDKAVQRSGKQFAALMLVRLLIALGAAPEIISLVQKAFG